MLTKAIRAQIKPQNFAQTDIQGIRQEVGYIGAGFTVNAVPKRTRVVQTDPVIILDCNAAIMMRDS
jgi:hypothetical protein